MLRRRLDAWNCALLTFSLALAHVPLAQDEHDRRGIVGVLALPEVFGRKYCEQTSRQEIPLYSEPQSTDIIGWIRADKDRNSTDDCDRVTVNVHRRADGSVHALPTQEHIGEEVPPAAIVLEERRPWFKVRLRDGVAWLRAQEDEANYFPLANLLGGVAYATEAWDGRLAARPGGRLRRPPRDLRRTSRDRYGVADVWVVDSRKVGDTLWLYVQFLSHAVYEKDEEPRVTARGWMPAHNAAGDPTVWFATRD